MITSKRRCAIKNTFKLLVLFVLSSSIVSAEVYSPVFGARISVGGENYWLAVINDLDNKTSYIVRVEKGETLYTARGPFEHKVKRLEKDLLVKKEEFSDDIKKAVTLSKIGTAYRYGVRDNGKLAPDFVKCQHITTIMLEPTDSDAQCWSGAYKQPKHLLYCYDSKTHKVPAPVIKEEGDSAVNVRICF